MPGLVFQLLWMPGVEISWRILHIANGSMMPSNKSKRIDNYVFVYKANRKGCYGTFLDIGLGDFLPGFQHKQI